MVAQKGIFVTNLVIFRGRLIKTHACHRNVLCHFWFKPFSIGKPYKFGVTTINRKIPNAFKGTLIYRYN